MEFLRVHVGSLVRAKLSPGSMGCAWVLLMRAKRASGSFGFVGVHLGAPWVVVFILVCVGYLGRALWSSYVFGFSWDFLWRTSGAFEYALVHSGAPSGRRVHSGAIGSSFA